MNYEVHLDNFNGPMDLLLHLVKETKLDIYEIKMQDIIEGYLTHIKNMQSLNIYIGSEFLVMASNLVHLKSKMLIGASEENDSTEENEITSEEDLRSRIIEYERIKKVTEELKALESKRSEIYTKLPESLSNYQEELKLFNDDGLSTSDLIKALNDIEKRRHYLEPVETKITRRELSVHERTNYIRNILKEKKKCNFYELFEYGTKEYIIVTFLAILEMCRAKEIKLNQESNFDSLLVEALWIKKVF